MVLGFGGYVEYVFRRAAAELFNVLIIGEIDWVKMCNVDMCEVILMINGEVVLCVVVVYGFRNI